MLVHALEAACCTQPIRYTCLQRLQFPAARGEGDGSAVTNRSCCRGGGGWEGGAQPWPRGNPLGRRRSRQASGLALLQSMSTRAFVVDMEMPHHYLAQRGQGPARNGMGSATGLGLTTARAYSVAQHIKASWSFCWSW